MDYIITNNLDKFYLSVPQYWNKLMMGLIGETLTFDARVNFKQYIEE